MKRILSLLAITLLTAGTAFSQGSINEIDSEHILGNNRYLASRDSTGQHVLKVIKSNSSGNTVVNAPTGGSILLQVAETTEVTLSNDAITFSGTASTIQSAGSLIAKVDADAQRFFTFDASSDTALTTTFGDGGTTAAQVWTLSGSTADADDDGTIEIAGGGSSSVARGSSFRTYGNEVATIGGFADVFLGGTTSNFRVTGNNGTGELLNLEDSDDSATFAGAIKMASAGTADKGLVLGASAIPADVSSAIAQPQLYSFTATNASHKALGLFQGSADANPVKIIAGKSRATDGSANTVVSSGDSLLAIEAFAADGADFETSSAIYFESDAASGSNDVPGRIVFFTSPDGSNSLAEVLRLSSTKAATFAGAVTSSATASLGWAVVDGADNTSCETSCTSAAVFGIDLAAGASAPVIVASDSASADVCLCAGAS